MKMENVKWTKNVFVYIDIKIDGEDIGQIELELFKETPITSENFR